MASENMSVAAPTVEVQISTLLDKIEAMRQEQLQAGPPRLLPMQAEMRTLEFWRSVIAECIATFLFVFIVSGAASSSVTGGSPTSTTLAAACAAGLSVAALSACFYHVSGAHINPAISIAMAFTKQISTFRAFMFVVAQCGGGIAGAAILYGISNPNHYVNLNARASHSPFHLSAWDRFASEMVLTFVVVFTYFITTDRKRKLFNRPHFPVAAAYFACGLVAMPSLNPARALGPAFVLNKWTDHWVNWCGPISGGILAAFIFEHIFNSNRQKNSNTNMDEDSSSIHSDEDTYDDLDKQRSTYNTLRAIQSGTDLYRTMAAHPTSPNGVIHGYCPSLNSASLYSAPSKIDRVESLYAGTKSLYTKSPVLTRANLHRSQSVYTKSSNSQPMAPMASVNMRESPPRPGPLIPAQSLYPMRLNTISAPSPSNSSVSNQNQQNQQRLGMENVYGVRSAIMNATGVYGKQANSNQDSGYSNGNGNNPSKHSKRDDYGYTHHISSNQKGTSCNAGMKQCNSYHTGMTQGSRSEHSALQMQQNLGIPTVGPPPPYPQSQPGLQY